jgi:hypothetical protein
MRSRAPWQPGSIITPAQNRFRAAVGIVFNFPWLCSRRLEDSFLAWPIKIFGAKQSLSELSDSVAPQHPFRRAWTLHRRTDP